MIVKAYLDKARRAARHSNFQTYKVGCILATGSYIHAVASNKKRDNARIPCQYHSWHAELLAVETSRGRLP